MITIQKLVQNILQCRSSKLALPKMNNEENLFLQKTAIELRKLELDSVSNVFSSLSEANFTMDKELEQLNQSLIKETNSNLSPIVSNSMSINSDALIIYNENETAPLPEIILKMISYIHANKDEWYIYGVKNPESFYKSFLLLTHIDFIIKNKTEKKNEVATFKREMAMHYETFYKTLNYRALRFAHVEMIHKLTNLDNYCEYDAVKYTVDYSKTNLIILDIINCKYLDIVSNQSSNIASNIDNKNDVRYVIIIKYANETYLPLMNSNGNHKFKSNILEYISHNFERIQLQKYKEPHYSSIIASSTTSTTSTSSTSTTSTSSNIETYDSGDEPGKITDSKIISVFFNNAPIITQTEQPYIAIEEMIEINEKPSQQSKILTIKDIETIQHTNISSMLASGNEPFQNNKSEIKLEELKPLKQYTLQELQILARLYKVDPQKEGKTGKKINKTKEEIYNEISSKN